MVDTEAGFEFAVVVFDLSADLRQPDEGLQSGTGARLDSQYLTGSGWLGGHSAISHSTGRLPSSLRGMPRLAGRMRMARKCERILALRLLGVARVPCRQVICRTRSRPAARTSCLNVRGGSG